MRNRMLAVAFGPPTMAAACAGLPRIRAAADCVELRLDLFDEPFDLATLLRERGELTVVATLRPPEQGGRSKLDAAARLEVLLRAAELGAEYVDLEWDAATPAALAALTARGARVIVSRHDFSDMPRGLADEWWPRLAALGADVVKVVGTARDVRDGLLVLRAFERAELPTIAIGMGAAGLPTRVLALRSERCLLTYAALDDGVGTAPGQISVGDMRQVYGVQRLGSSTRVYGLLGAHAERDRLADYNAWFAADAVDAVAVPFPAEANAAEIIASFKTLPVRGWHIHGESLQRDALRALDNLRPAAGRQAKVNAVVMRPDGSLFGAWVESPREQYELWRSAAD
jgi:3-dehydroquinate dehydratase/shikimate dehydrogenase